MYRSSKEDESLAHSIRETGKKKMMKTMSMLGEKKEENLSNQARTSVLGTMEILLRLVPLGLCIASLVLMLKDSQDNDYGSVSYENIGAFKYLVYANGVCAAYSLFSAFYSAMPRPSTLSRAWTFFFLDQVMTYVVLAGGTVSTEILYLAYKGDVGVTWSKACGVFGGFCSRASESVGITLGAAGCYVLLSICSSYRLFSTYESPIPFLATKGVEIAAFPGEAE